MMARARLKDRVALADERLDERDLTPGRYRALLVFTRID